jgi:cadmium resistance protein CadD (predicted permease)
LKNISATILSALAVFILISIDFLLILGIVFFQTWKMVHDVNNASNQFLDFAMLVTIRILITFVRHFGLEEWIIGLLDLGTLSCVYAQLPGKEEKEIVK